MKSEISNVILDRTFDATDKNGVSKTVRLQISKPYFTSEGNSSLDWYCPFQIHGIDSERVHHGLGRDSIDALLVALKLAQHFIQSYSNNKSENITWFGDSHLGLDTIPTNNDNQQESGTGHFQSFKHVFDNFFSPDDSEKK